MHLGAHVKTDLGEGFVVGRNLTDLKDQRYSVMLFDGGLCHMFETREKWPIFKTIEVIDPTPTNHPKIPASVRQLIADRSPKSTKIVIKDEDSPFAIPSPPIPCR